MASIDTPPTTAREHVRIGPLAAWHYPGTNGACVVMAGGTGVTKEPATDRFAARFNEAGFSVLAFDFRGFGESEGEPRQVVRVRDQLADWEAAAAFAAGLPEVESVALWGFSLSGGHVMRVAARAGGIAAVIAQAALADGQAAAPNALRSMTPLALARLTGRGVLDAIGGLLGRPPLLVPLAGARGEVASLTTPDSADAGRALNPGGRYPGWQQTVAARSALTIGLYRPGRAASRVPCPLLVVAYEDDRSALPGPAIRAGERAPRGEVARLPGGHYAGFLEAHEQTVEAELDFLRRHLLG